MICGVDGCPAGWIVLRRKRGAAIESEVCRDAAAVLAACPAPAVVAIDIPIGLPDAGRRECDTRARRALGPRRSSVFPAPVRASLRAKTREQASAITSRIDGRKVSAQAFAILPRIRDVDRRLRSDPGLLSRVHEVHPELSFRALNGGEPLRHAKRTAPGKAERLALISDRFGAGAFAAVRARLRRPDVADDDIADAFALLWSAGRLRAGRAHRLPPEAPRDARGLPMQIAY